MALLRPLVDDNVDHLRNDVAGTLDDDGVADPDVAALAQLLAVAADSLDVILIVQRHVLHDDAADPDRLELADRRERAGAADLDLDVLQHGHGALGRKFVRDRPARRARHETQALLPVKAVDLVDYSVDVVVEPGALFLDLAMERDQLLDGMAQPGQRIGPEPAAFEPFDHAGLGDFRHRAHLAPGIGEEAERPRRGDAGVLLAQRARRRIARVGEDGAAFGLLPLVERKESLLGHVDLAADLADRRHVASLELLRHVLEGADIGGDVFALGAVAAGRRGHEFAALVTQRHRQPVDLRLGAERDLVVPELEKAFDARDEIQHILLGEGVVERQHRYRVADFLKSSGRRRADLLRRQIGGDELRKAGLDGVETLAQRVVFGVGNAGRVVLVVALVMALQFKRQSFQLHPGLRLGEFCDVGENLGFAVMINFARHSDGAGPTQFEFVAEPSSAALRGPGGAPRNDITPSRRAAIARRRPSLRR